jgi:hypothetical protein
MMCIWRFGRCERHGVWAEDHGAGSIQRWRYWEGKKGWMAWFCMRTRTITLLKLH